MRLESNRSMIELDLCCERSKAMAGDLGNIMLRIAVPRSSSPGQFSL